MRDSDWSEPACGMCGRRSCTGECEMRVDCFNCRQPGCDGACDADNPANYPQYAELTDPPPSFVAGDTTTNRRGE